MPARPRQPCKAPGCDALAEPGKSRCADCTRRTRRTTDHIRPSASERGYGTTHRTRFRQGVLARDRMCVLCTIRPATVADHWPLSRRELQAQNLDPNDPRYGRGLCADCDPKQTAVRQPGGWNRR